MGGLKEIRKQPPSVKLHRRWNKREKVYKHVGKKKTKIFLRFTYKRYILATLKITPMLYAIYKRFLGKKWMGAPITYRLQAPLPKIKGV